MRYPRLWRARMTAVLATAALAAGLLVSLSGPAGAAASPDEARLLSMANTLRASVGAAPLALDDALSGVARTWAASMAAAGTISHNPSLTTEVTGWMKLAENVGMGPSIESVQSALVASHPHYVNLTDTEVTAVGIGVATSGSTVFVVEDFLGRSGAAPTAAASVASPAAPPVASPPTTRTTVGPATSTTTVAPPTRVTVPPPAATPAVTAPAEPEPAPSPWLALALEVTRGWERAGR
ncbi:MAG TPA: CAP domain-containing protein [Acidimicrobiales bacterium]|nr:CAP domain-containing protein [Acidimicrobiales bacterium]